MSAIETQATAGTDREVLISRTFDAPRELVFKAWTDPEHLVHWYAPRGCTIEIREMDIREGGVFHHCIRTPDSHDCWCRGVYLEVAPPERIVCTMFISNENGDFINATDAGMDPDWPSETKLTVEFKEQDGKTTVTLYQTVSEALAKRTGAYPSWLDMLNRLDELVQKMK